jgi:hypothetical protein
LIIHERLGTWARQLRQRLAEGTPRVVETRSQADLERALQIEGGPCPVVLIDLAKRSIAGLDDLDRAARTAPDALVLVLDPEAREGVASLARELGATHVMCGPVTPPEVAKMLSRWLVLAEGVAETAGWSAAPPAPPEPEPWSWLSPLLNRQMANDR